MLSFPGRGECCHFLVRVNVSFPGGGECCHFLVRVNVVISW